MEKKLNKALDELISFVNNSDDYKKCVEIKEKLGKNDEVERLVKEIKKYQKEYVKTNDKEILRKLDDLTKELEAIPLYNIYNIHLEKVNQMIDIIKDELTKYFDNLLNDNAGDLHD